jgi:hypothetical protein
MKVYVVKGHDPLRDTGCEKRLHSGSKPKNGGMKGKGMRREI